MNDKRWVQHISGQGRKYELCDIPINKVCLEIPSWINAWVAIGQPISLTLQLPKSDYLLCDPPARWVDVTAECQVWPQGEMYPFGIRHHDTLINKCGHEIDSGYRLRKVPICTGDGRDHEPTKHWAFIIEKREP